MRDLTMLPFGTQGLEAAGSGSQTVAAAPNNADHSAASPARPKTELPTGTPVTMEAMSALLAAQLAPITGSVSRLESDFHTFKAEVHGGIVEVMLVPNQMKCAFGTGQFTNHEY
jgi:hypothetical protein